MKTSDVVCLGTVKLGLPDYGFSSSGGSAYGAHVSFLNTVESLGVHMFDTSPRYGRCEEFIGEYVEQAKVIPLVSTKVDCLNPHNSESPNLMLASVRSSIAKLRLSKIDICYLHQNEIDLISDPYIHEGIAFLKHEGLIARAGVSVYSLEECRYSLESGMFDVVQMPISVFDVSIYECARHSYGKSVGIAARSLLLQGILTNRSSIRARIKQWQEILDYLDQLDRIAESCGLTTLQLALAFVFSLPGVERYIVGTSSSDNLKSNISCLNLMLPSKIFEQVYDMASQFKSWTNPRSWN